MGDAQVDMLVHMHMGMRMRMCMLYVCMLL